MVFRPLLLLLGILASVVANAGDMAERVEPLYPPLPHVEGFPSQPIRLIVYTSPGGLIDVTSRRFARIAQDIADHPFAVINRPGGGGIVAFEEALREPADGHRLLAVTRSNISRMVASGREDLIDRIHWHSYIMDNPHVLITNSDEGAADWPSLLAATTHQGIQQRWLGVDIGGVKHLSGVSIAEATGVDMRWIPYGSGGEAVAALLGGLGTAYLGNPRDALASPRLRVVVVAADERLREFPDAPTFAELGFDGLEDELIWRGFAFRKGIPDEVQAWYSALIRQVLHDPRWVSAWQHEAVNLRYRGHQDFTRVVERDRDEFRRLLGQLDLLPVDEPVTGLARLTENAGLAGLSSLAGLLVIGLGLGLGRSRWRDQRGEVMLLGSLGLVVIIGALVAAQLPSRNVADPVGPAGIPIVWLLALIPLLIWQLISTFRQPPADPEVVNAWRLLVTIGLFTASLVLMPLLGYLLVSLLYMPSLIWYLGYRKPWVIASLTLAWLLFSELVFQRLMHVDLPRGVLLPW
ncbi:MAG: tripartite tricarboxylate transporter substrate binding protein [Wenzhouxiangella sp.]